MLIAAYEKYEYYNPSEPLAIDEVTVLFKLKSYPSNTPPPPHRK
jgi:hypothetical protein